VSGFGKIYINHRSMLIYVLEIKVLQNSATTLQVENIKTNDYTMYLYQYMVICMSLILQNSNLYIFGLEGKSVVSRGIGENYE